MGEKNDGELLLSKGSFEAGVSNMRPMGQNRPGKDTIMSHLMDLEYVKDCIDFSKDLPTAIHTTPWWTI